MPEQIGEEAAVGVAGGKDVTSIDPILLAQIGEHGVKQMQIAVTLISFAGLPAGFAAFAVQLGGGVQALEVDHDGFRPELMQAEAAGHH